VVLNGVSRSFSNSVAFGSATWNFSGGVRYLHKTFRSWLHDLVVVGYGAGAASGFPLPYIPSMFRSLPFPLSPRLHHSLHKEEIVP